MKLSAIIVLATALTLGTTVCSAAALKTANVVTAGQTTYLSLATFGRHQTNSDNVVDKLTNNVFFDVNAGHLWPVGSSMAYGVKAGFSHSPTIRITDLKDKEDAATTPHVESILNINSLNMFAVGKYYLSPKFNANAKLGASYLMLSRSTKIHAKPGILV